MRESPGGKVSWGGEHILGRASPAATLIIKLGENVLSKGWTIAGHFFQFPWKDVFLFHPTTIIKIIGRPRTRVHQSYETFAFSFRILFSSDFQLPFHFCITALHSDSIVKQWDNGIHIPHVFIFHIFHILFTAQTIKPCNDLLLQPLPLLLSPSKIARRQNTSDGVVGIKPDWLRLMTYG